MSQYTLFIKLDENLDNDIVDYYTTYKPNHIDDSGFDLPAIQNNSISELISDSGFIKSTGIKFGISCCMKNNDTEKCVGYYLYPRSSFHKYNLIVANHLGIIDAGYRGPITGMVKPLYYYNYPSNLYINKGTKLFQICAPDLSPFDIKLVEELPESSRGTDCFGSTGK